MPNPVTRRTVVSAGMTLAGSSLLSAASPVLAGQEATTPKPMEPPTPKPAPALPPQERVGWAILGLGKFATDQILPAFSDCRLGKPVAVISGSPAKARDLAKQYGVAESAVYGYNDWDKIRANPAIQVVYVITPNGTHRDFTVSAAKAGKHVLCEKPLANSPSDCETMIRACRDANKLLMTAYRAQYEPFNLEAMRRCRGGELGRIVTVTSDHGRQVEPTKDRADTWRVDKKLAGGGSLVDIGIYSLQAARYLTGEEPVEVTARISSPPNDPRFREVEATVQWIMRFPSGAMASLSSSYDWEDTKRLRVQGAKGWLELDPATDYYRHRLRVGSKPKPDGDLVVEEPQIKEQNQFALMMDHFSDCVRTGRTPKTPGEEGLRDVRYIEAIYESGKTGRLLKLG